MRFMGAIIECHLWLSLHQWGIVQIFSDCEDGTLSIYCPSECMTWQRTHIPAKTQKTTACRMCVWNEWTFTESYITVKVSSTHQSLSHYLGYWIGKFVLEVRRKVDRYKYHWILCIRLCTVVFCFKGSMRQRVHTSTPSVTEVLSLVVV